MAAAVVLFAEGFEEIEAITIVDVLRRAGVEVTTVGLDGLNVNGAHAVSIGVDRRLNEIDATSVDAVILPGGLPGSENLAGDAGVLDLLRRADQAGCLIGAICAAPIALEAAGLLNGCRMTCYPSFEQGMANVEYSGARVEEDGRIVTGIGPGAALEFSLRLVEHLVDADTAETLRHGMLVQD